MRKRRDDSARLARYTRAMQLLEPVAVMVTLGLVSCAPSAMSVRQQRVSTAQTGARQTPGARQAIEYARAVDAAFTAGDYQPAANAQAGRAVATDALANLDRVVPTAGPDAPTLIAWRALILVDLGRADEGFAELKRSFAVGPNATAGAVLIPLYGRTNQQAELGEVCRGTVSVITDDSEKLDIIARCRTATNASTPAGEMAWMPPELVTWYQAEHARRIGAAIEADNARAAQETHENQVVHQMEACSATCKERGLYCQNRCERDDTNCDGRCVEINHACLDRCEANAKSELDR